MPCGLRVAVYLALGASLLSTVIATHFRGAMLSWKPINASDPSDTRVTISSRIAWRLTYSSSTHCDQSTIASGKLIGPAGYLQCRVGCSGNVGSMYYKCTDFSVSENWSGGEQSYVYTFPSSVNPPLFEASFSGRDWIGLVQGGGSWEVRIYFNLTQRNDTGRLNSSPITAMTPIVKLQHGCNHTIEIPVRDADKDEVRCRWAEYSKGECAGVCQTFRGARLNERQCKIEYSATGSLGWYAVALMIEDFSSPVASSPLSSVPLQFLVNVFSSSEQCQSKPEFVGTTRVDGSCIGVPFGTQYAEAVIARSGGKISHISEITTISPQGLLKSGLGQLSSREWYMNVTWTPKQSQLGPNIFCFTAVDSTGLTSSQRCITLLGGVAPPTIVSGSQSPTGLIYANHAKWVIKFDKQFVRPKKSRYIRVLQADGHEVYSMDVAITSTMVYPAGSVGRTLEFALPYSFTEKETYYIVMDPGIAKGTKNCGAESPAMRDPFFWRVKIRDITPPSVTFVSSPSLTNDNITFTWKANEEATMVCTIIAPDRVFRSPCNDSWTGIGLQEGSYRISVMATDTAGNTAQPVTRSWTVDKTPPRPYLTAKPANVTRFTSARFSFACTDKDWYRASCSYECDVRPQGAQPSGYRSCSGSFTASNLVDGTVYVFWLRSRDKAGNLASVLTYKWRIDRVSPVISGLNPLTVPCTSDLDPESIGKPTVTDNEDPDPRVTHKDSPLASNCGVLRTWIATDRAGNSASGTQTIKISNPSAPVAKYNRSIIVACETLVGIAAGLDKEISVSHPCGMPVNITHADSIASMRCDITFTRYWTIRDACGFNTTVPQSIRVLGLQPPDYPTNSQVNVELNQQLSWPQYPGAVRYRVYIWKYQTPQPGTPTATTSSRVYSPSSQQYPHGTKLLWKVEYILQSGHVIPGPVWGFSTRPYMDFKVETVTVPPGAFSGQSLTVSWTVRNIGGTVNAVFSWDDLVYIGKTTSLSDARLLTRKRQNRILDTSDAYTDSATGNLGNSEIGIYYAFVVTYNSGDDIDRSNNRKMSSRSVKIALTPPPNLKVDSVAIPSTTFSGRSISVTWVVKNHGLGTTKEDRWYDRVVLSRDNLIDRGDTTLRDVKHQGQLFAGLSYRRSESVRIPDAVYGNFTILVTTDVRNDVFEYTADGDNTLASKALKVILTPPPDLVVSGISTNGTFQTGNTVVIVYRVKNEGFGAPFETFWSDELSLTNLATNTREVLGTSYFSGVLPPQGSYSRQLRFTVPPRLKTGHYNLSVYTDVRNQVFEFTFDNNNIAHTRVTVIEAFPDMRVPELKAKIGHDAYSAYITLNFTISNNGAGKTYGAPWTDGIFISTSPAFSLGSSKLLGSVTRKENLPPGQRYDVINALFRIRRDIYGPRYIIVYADSYLSVAEEARANNFGHTEQVQVPRVLPDLMVKSLRISGSTQLFADTSVTLNWEVENVGVGSTLEESWYDAIYLSRSETPQRGDRKLYEVSTKSRLSPGSSYTKTATVTLPDGITGDWNLILKANNEGKMTEVSLGNNIRSLLVSVELPSRPDLMVLGVSYYYRQSLRLLRINWLVRNDAFSMDVSKSWSDQVLLSPSYSRIEGNDVFILGSKVTEGLLYSQQEYGAIVSYTLPKALRGTYYVHVLANSDGKLKETLRGRSNNGFSDIPLELSRAPTPKLETRIVTEFNSTSVTQGGKFRFEFDVRNSGTVDASQNSWTDAVYIYNSPGAGFNEVYSSGNRLALITHTGGLAADQTYNVATNIAIPYKAASPVYFYAFSDVYNKTGSNVITGSASNPVPTTPGALPDLVAAFKESSLQTRGGQPFKVTFNVTNAGMGSTRDTWFNALYLSEDVLLDPFDQKLGSHVAITGLRGNSSVEVELEVFIPFDTLRGEYYFLVVVDSDNRVYESKEENNIAYVLVRVQSAPSTDLLVSSVYTQPQVLGVGSNLQVDWKLRNNGTRLATGYKCDTVYLSQDDKWQIDDTSIGRPKCGFVSLNPYNAGANPDLPYSLTSPLPILPPGQYRGLVKSRSNIRDVYPDNNIKAGAKNVNVTFPTLDLGTCKDVTSSMEVYVVPGVAADETLIVTARANTTETTQYLYLRHNKPATTNKYDAGSKFAISANQKAIVESTRSGEYYILLQKSDKNPQQLIKAVVCAKLAKFEITTVTPDKVAPLGNATLKIQGSLFGWDLEATLMNEQENGTLRALEIYRFRSSLVYITFNFTGVPVGTVYNVRLADKSTGKTAYLNNSVTIKEGIPGKISMVLNSPRAFRAEEIGHATISYQNIGDTDVASPISLFTASGVTIARLLQDGKVPGGYSQSILFIAQPLEGPGGIIPPQSSGQVSFQVKQQEGGATGRTRLGVTYIVSSSEPHMFMNSSAEFKPDHVSEELWRPVWRNFLSSVGRTQQSLNDRLCSVATRLSVAGRRLLSVEELIKFQINLANGLQYGSPLLDIIDLADTGSNGRLVLQLERVYSPLLTQRRDTGVFGVGWITPWWEIKVSFMDETTVKILKSRDELVFNKQESTGVYVSRDKLRVSVNNTDIVFVDGAQTYVFDSRSQRLKEIRSNEHAQNETITVTSYTAEGRPRDLSYSGGGRLTVVFNNRGLIREAVLVKASGQRITSLYEYNADSNLLTSVTINDKTTRYTYTAERDIKSVTYPNGAELRYTYNEHDLMSGMASYAHDGSKFKDLQFDSDWNGSLKTTDKMKGSSFALVFDENLKPFSVAGHDGIPARTQSHVSERQIIRKTLNGDQVIQTQTFDIPKRTMTTEDANGNTMSYVSNADGFPQNVSDPAGNAYSYVYNEQNKVVESRLPDDSRETSKYDGEGRLVTRTTRNGRDIRFEYGTDGHVAKKSIPDVGPTYYLHDSRGNLIMATNKVGTISIQYDKENRPISVTYPDKRRLQYRYDMNGRRVGLAENSTGYNVTYRYDKFNRIVEVHSRGDLLMKIQQNSTGNTEKRTFGNGATTWEQFSLGSRTLKEMHNLDPNGNECSKFEYEYDRKGRPIKIKTLAGTRVLKYDAMSQLVGWADIENGAVRNESKYGYDSRKNRVYHTDEVTGQRVNYVSNNVSQYTAAEEFDFAYDNNGNLRSKKSRESRTKDVKLVFSEDNVLLKTETANERCDYLYDGLGLLYKKSCASGETRYIMDPFGIFGENTIGQVSDGNVTHFVHAEEKGLISMILNGEVYYYQFNGEGSVISLMKDGCESPVNSYEYDPFGRLLSAREAVRNDFLFVGQWGVMRDKDIPGMYRMRFRHYDSQIGRFISYDPLADASLETNFYLYANNNPVMLQDPNGRVALLIIGGGALIGSAASVVAYTLGSLATGEKWTIGGAAGSAVSGALTGAVTTATATLGPVAAAYIGSRTAALANGLGYAVQTAIDGTPFNGKDLLTNMANGLVFGGLPIKTPGLSKTGLPEVVKKFADGVTGGLVSGLTPKLDKVWNRMKDLANKMWDGTKNAAKDLYNKMKKAFQGFLDWIRSRDPNDMIGPAGVGDARFIRGDVLLNYKIRYENHPNATAPAQRVLIRHRLDSDLDPRSFTVGSFGFGNFTKNVETKSPVLQEMLDYQPQHSLFVRITAGIDIVSNEVTWDLQTVDPKTGEPPDDPRKGFLPPNNGTTGQGHVTFTIKAKSDVRSMARIDAQASIIFDRNEPIETPPIFNTIDNTRPSHTNLTVLQDALETGALVVMVTKRDVGAGVRSVDIYYQEQQENNSRAHSTPVEFKPLLRDIEDDTAVLPLAQGKSYRLVTGSVDHVGNHREPAYDHYTLVNFRKVTSKQPLESLRLEASSNATQEDTPIPVHLSARFVGLNVTNTSLTITIYGVPENFEFSRGVRSKDKVILKETDFGNLILTPAKTFSGSLSFKVTATGTFRQDHVTYSAILAITVRAKADVPSLAIKDACFNGSNHIPLSISSDVTDKDGSENLTLAVAGLPQGYRLSTFERIVNGTYFLRRGMLSGLVIIVHGEFRPFSFKVVALAVELSNGDTATKTANVTVTVCKFSCENNCSGHGKCVGQDTCACDEGFSGHDCSAVIETVTPGKGDTQVAAIVGGVLGGLLFIILLAALLVFCRKRTKDTRAGAQMDAWYTNPAYGTTAESRADCRM